MLNPFPHVRRQLLRRSFSVRRSTNNVTYPFRYRVFPFLLHGMVYEGTEDLACVKFAPIDLSTGDVLEGSFVFKMLFGVFNCDVYHHFA